MMMGPLVAVNKRLRAAARHNFRPPFASRLAKKSSVRNAVKEISKDMETSEATGLQGGKTGCCKAPVSFCG